MRKWSHYFEIYDRHFARFRGRPVRMMEIGVGEGGSLEMWRSYFGRDAEIIGVDCNEQCRRLEEDGFRIEIGDQKDRGFLRRLAAKYAPLDIIVDDGGHRMEQQVASFQELFFHLQESGIYLCEDLHTNYWPEYGGGLRAPKTFLEMTKGLIDSLNAWHSRDAAAHPVNEFTRRAWSIHYYDSVVVVERRSRTVPGVESAGRRGLGDP